MEIWLKQNTTYNDLWMDWENHVETNPIQKQTK